jgi:GNAT superfamily N-acetyltransferase
MANSAVKAILEPEVGSGVADLVECAEAAHAVATARGRKRWFKDLHVDFRESADICAVFAGHWTHLTQAFVTGRAGEGQIEAAEDFFRSYESPSTFHVCERRARLVQLLLSRRYRRISTAAVLIQRLTKSRPPPVATTAGVTSHASRPAWIRIVSEGFIGRELERNAPELEIGGIVASMPDAKLYHASDGEGEGAAAALALYRRTAILFCDATAPSSRGRGLHAALIGARVRDAARLGCEIATATAVPDSASYRNYLRAGFTEAYQRVTLQSLDTISRTR